MRRICGNASSNMPRVVSPSGITGCVQSAFFALASATPWKLLRQERSSQQMLSHHGVIIDDIVDETTASGALDTERPSAQA